jgi:hypothetical protein
MLTGFFLEGLFFDGRYQLFSISATIFPEISAGIFREIQALPGNVTSDQPYINSSNSLCGTFQ